MITIGWEYIPLKSLKEISEHQSIYIDGDEKVVVIK